MDLVTFEQKHIKSFDGTDIGYQVAGEGKTPFVLCNGLGGSMIAWSPIYNYFFKQFRFITWDYRGLFTSGIPENHATLDIPYHVRDLEVILKKERITNAIVGGWSMGVQVCLEFYRQRPDFFKALFLINGTYGYPLKTAFNSPLSRYIIPVVNSVLKKVLPRVQHHLTPVAKRVIDTDQFIRLIIRMGLIHKNFDVKVLRQIAGDIITTDLGVYHEVLDHLGLHNAEDVLETVKVPTLIMAGTNDLMTPSKAAEHMAKKIKHAELYIINEASHYSLLEFPNLINRRLEQFLREHKLMSVKRQTRAKLLSTHQNRKASARAKSL